MTIGAASLVALILFTSCSGGGGASTTPGASTAVTDETTGFATYTGEPQKGGTVTILGGVDFAHLDPAKGNDGNVNNLYALIYRNLTQYQVDPGTGELELVGDLATDTGTPNDDATVWTFTLKDGVMFEDGSPITAEDVKFGLERAFDPSLAIGSDYLQNAIKGAAEYQGVFEQPEGLDSIVVIDDKTIEFHTEQPMADFPNVLATPPGAPFPKDKVTSAGQIQQTPIASGPYRVENYSSGQSLTLVRNENWDETTDDIRPAYPDSYEFLLSLDQSTIDQRLISGQGEDVNAVASSTNPLEAANLARVQQSPELKARTVQSIPGCNQFLVMNTTKGPFGDAEVRRAVNFAVNKSSVVNATGGPVMADVANNMLLPSVPDFDESDPYATPDNAGDPEKAKQMLAEAGYPDGFEVTMDVRALPVWQAQAEAVQQSLAQAGVTVNLNVIDSAKFYEVIATTSQQKDMAITGWCANGWFSGEPLLTPLFDGNRITETGNQNQSQINDPEINEAFAEAEIMTDVDEKYAAYAEIDKMIMDQSPVVPMVRTKNLQLVGTNVGGAMANPARTGYIDYGQLGLLDPGK